jgi:hypothetical protein
MDQQSYTLNCTWAEILIKLIHYLHRVFANSSGKKKPLCYHFDQWNSCIFNFNQLSTIYQKINEDTAQ